MSKIAKIFLSHSSNDNEFVRRLAKDLKLKDVPIWFDEWELKVGDSLHEKISSGIKESSWLGIILSKNSTKSDWVQKELNAALTEELQKKQVFVLPIVIEDCEIPVFLKDKVYADFRKDYNEGFQELLRTLKPDNQSSHLFEQFKNISDNRKKIPIKKTGGAKIGLCNLKLPGCTAQNKPAPVIEINLIHKDRNINVCPDCLQQKVNIGDWRVEENKKITPSNDWIGVSWKGKFLAYDGPIESLNLIEDRIYEKTISNALTNGGFHPRRCNPEKLAKHAEKGYKIIYLTDKISWRQRIVDGRQILMAKPYDS